MKAEEIVLVLMAPQGARNIGAVGRAMQNFGVSELRLVTPEVDHLGDEARHMAVRAVGVLEEARLFDTLAAALADCSLIFGTTRRFGKYREDLLVPSQVAELIASQSGAGRIALVFGREDSGLTTAELDLCHHLLSIPTSETLPSMNLSHAVAVCLYALFVGLPGTRSDTAKTGRAASSEEVEAMFAHMRQSLLDIHYLDPQNPDHVLRTFRRLFGRAGLSERDVSVLRGLWNRIDWIEGERRKSGV